jgi:hypothetical protein
MKKKDNNIKKSRSIFLIPIDHFFEKNKKYNVYNNHSNIFFQNDNDSSNSSNSLNSVDENGEINSFFLQNKTILMNNIFSGNWKTKIYYFKRYKLDMYKKKA